MALTGRQRQFLAAAYKAAPSQDDEFIIEQVGASLGYDAEESLDIAQTLEREFEYLHGTLGMPAEFTPAEQGRGFSLTIRVNERPAAATLSTSGREAAREMMDEARGARRARMWRIIKWTWATLMSLAIPVSITILNRKIERIERQQERGPNATTQAATRP